MLTFLVSLAVLLPCVLLEWYVKSKAWRTAGVVLIVFSFGIFTMRAGAQIAGDLQQSRLARLFSYALGDLGEVKQDPAVLGEALQKLREACSDPDQFELVVDEVGLLAGEVRRKK